MKDELTHIVEGLRSSMSPSGKTRLRDNRHGNDGTRAYSRCASARPSGAYWPLRLTPEEPELGVDEVVRSGGKTPKTYADAAALANDPDVDAILICTPNFTHRAVFDQVKATGKPIFLEKPMATTLDDALYLAEEALNYPAPIQLGMQYRYKSQYQLALSALERNELGSVKMISLCEYRPPFLPKVREWNKFSEYSAAPLLRSAATTSI